jgi:hypothetical protein
MFIALWASSAEAQVQVKSEDVTFRFGVLGQLWGSWVQDPSANYQQNLYLRRARIMAGGEIGQDISFFLQTDSPNLGKTPKSPTDGFMLQDAFLEWKASNRLRVNGGLMLVPLSRNTLQSPASYYTIDLSRLTAVNNSVTQSAALRDLGMGARGFFLKDKLQYRFGVFQGERDADARNSLRTSGYIQYDFFDSETGYTFAGTALGKKKILALDAGFDAQGSYHGASANLAFDLPLHAGDELGGQFQFFHYDGATKFVTLHEQNDWFVEGTYYFHRIKMQPFTKFEEQKFALSSDVGNNNRRVGGGLNYYVRGQNLKWTFQWMRVLPHEGSSLEASNEISMQLQLFYF